MGTPGKMRQAAFKGRMREAGKTQITVWVDADQERAIKAILAGKTPTLTPTHDPAPPTPHSLPVPTGAFIVPEVPNGMPEVAKKEIRESVALAKKKRSQATKLLGEVAGIERWIEKTVAEWRGVG